MTEVLLLFALAANAVAVGVFAGTILGGVPLLMSLPPERYVHAHGFLATRYDPFMPVTLAATALLYLVLTVQVTGAAGTTLFLLAGLLTISVMVVSVTRTVPINRWVVGLDPANLPADWVDRDPRQAWQTWNAVRSSLAAAALAVGLIAATTTLLA